MARRDIAARTPQANRKQDHPNNVLGRGKIQDVVGGRNQQEQTGQRVLTMAFPEHQPADRAHEHDRWIEGVGEVGDSQHRIESKDKCRRRIAHRKCLTMRTQRMAVAARNPTVGAMSRRHQAAFDSDGENRMTSQARMAPIARRRVGKTRPPRPRRQRRRGLRVLAVRLRPAKCKTG